MITRSVYCIRTQCSGQRECVSMRHSLPIHKLYIALLRILATYIFPFFFLFLLFACETRERMSVSYCEATVHVCLILWSILWATMVWSWMKTAMTTTWEATEHPSSRVLVARFLFVLTSIREKKRGSILSSTIHAAQHTRRTSSVLVLIVRFLESTRWFQWSTHFFVDERLLVAITSCKELFRRKHTKRLLE